MCRMCRKCIYTFQGRDLYHFFLQKYFENQFSILNTFFILFNIFMPILNILIRFDIILMGCN